MSRSVKRKHDGYKMSRKCNCKGMCHQCIQYRKYKVKKAILKGSEE